MNEALQLKKLGEYARLLRETYERIQENPPEKLDTTTRKHLDEVGRLARKTEELAYSPVKIGVVGEFNAGKTLLLGSLIGYADALPVSEIPTTGNVTALCFTPADELQTTAVEAFVIDYLSQSDVEECLRHMLRRAQGQAAVIQLRHDLLEQLGQFDASNQNGSLNQLERWCGEAWTVSNNPNWRYLLRELVAFTRAYFRCGLGMCAQPRPYTVSPDVAREGLTLPETRDVSSMSFADLPPAPLPISSPPEGLTAETLRATFPLIWRVGVRVRVARQVWDLSSVTGANQFVLLDFPGLGAAYSGVRDEFLCLRELKEVQTILILLNGDRPGGDEGGKLFDMMQQNRPHQSLRDAILVGVGRFDRLPLGNEGMEKLKRLAGAPVPAPARTSASVFRDEEEETPLPVAEVRLSEAEVQEQFPILKTCIHGAEGLVPAHRKDRIIFLSPMLSLKLLADNEPGIRVGTETFLENLPGDAARALELRALWKELARKLDRAAPGSLSKPGLARWLDDFATDGGIGRVRELILSHVQLHGLSQLLDDVQRQAQSLRAEVAKLSDLVAPAEQVVDIRTRADRVETARKRMHSLLDIYRDITHQVAQSLSLHLQRDGKPVRLGEVIQEETIFQIFEWNQWDKLFHASRKGFIAESNGGQAHALAGGDAASLFRDEGDEEVARAVFPTRSDDFYPEFEQTLIQLEEFTRQQLAASVEQWLGELAARVSAERQELEPLLANPELLKKLRTLKLGERGQGLVAALKSAVDPLHLKKLIFPDGDPARLEIEYKLNPATLFPLARGKAPGPAGRTFGWARALQERPEEFRPERNHAHQCQVYRLRDEFVSILTQEMSQLVSVALKKLNKNLEVVLDQLNTKLALAAGNDLVLDKLMEGAQSPGAAATTPTADPLAPLRQLTVVKWPGPA